LNDSKQDSFFSIPEDFDLSLNEGINIVSDYLKKGKSTASVQKGI
jgi:hypothetical protein